jgi:hypothetical protein
VSYALEGEPAHRAGALALAKLERSQPQSWAVGKVGARPSRRSERRGLIVRWLVS